MVDLFRNIIDWIGLEVIAVVSLLGVLVNTWLIRILFRDLPKLRVVVNYHVTEETELKSEYADSVFPIGAGFHHIEVYCWNEGRVPALIDGIFLVTPGKPDFLMGEEDRPIELPPRIRVHGAQVLQQLIGVEEPLEWWKMRGYVKTIDGKRHYSRFPVKRPEWANNNPPCLLLRLLFNRVRNLISSVWFRIT